MVTVLESVVLLATWGTSVTRGQSPTPAPPPRSLPACATTLPTLNPHMGTRLGCTISFDTSVVSSAYRSVTPLDLDEIGEGLVDVNYITPQSRTIPALPPRSASSTIISGITWDSASVIRTAIGSDLWPVTWGSDDSLYFSWGDGGGFGGTDALGRVSLGFARVGGTPPNITETNAWGGYNALTEPTFGGKVWALISVNATLYAIGAVWPGTAGVSTISSPMEARLLWSSDRGSSWQYTNWTFYDSSTTDFFYPTGFAQFGKDNEGARDGYVYLYGARSPQETSGLEGLLYLVRVPSGQLLAKAEYQWYAGLDAQGAPIWTSERANREPVFADTTGLGSPGDPVYNATLRRYVSAGQGRYVNQLSLFEAPEPWGPWSTIVQYSDWGGYGNKESLGFHFPAKWISLDGKTMWAVFSSTGNLDSFNLIKATLSLK